MAQLESELQKISTPHTIYLNWGGEILAAPQGSSGALTPYGLAGMVKSGAVWVDWCGWPMFYGSTGTYGAGGFGTFLSALGIVATDLPYDPARPIFGYIEPGQPGAPFTEPIMYGCFALPGQLGDGYDRSLIVDRSLSSMDTNGRPWQVNTDAPFQYWDIGGNRQYVYSSFAILAGNGAYIYAYGNDTPYCLWEQTSGLSYGVGLSQYLPFIRRIVASLPTISQPMPPGLPNPPEPPYGGPGSTVPQPPAPPQQGGGVGGGTSQLDRWLMWTGFGVASVGVLGIVGYEVLKK